MASIKKCITCGGKYGQDELGRSYGAVDVHGIPYYPSFCSQSCASAPINESKTRTLLKQLSDREIAAQVVFRTQRCAEWTIVNGEVVHRSTL